MTVLPLRHCTDCSPEFTECWNDRRKCRKGGQFFERLELVNRITQYLCVGGLVNPEMMEHGKVRDLLMDVRDHLLADSSTSSKKPDDDPK